MISVLVSLSNMYCHPLLVVAGVAHKPATIEGDKEDIICLLYLILNRDGFPGRAFIFTDKTEHSQLQDFFEGGGLGKPLSTVYFLLFKLQNPFKNILK